MVYEYEPPSSCYAMLKNSEDIFDRIAAAFLVLRLKDKDWCNVPPEEIEFAHNTMTSYHIDTMRKEKI